MATNSYQYGQLVTALAAAFDVPDSDLPAFRGRLRHLEKNGVPDLPAVGRGKIRSYTSRHLIELVLAIEWEAIGVSPSKIPIIIQNSRQHLPVQIALMNARSAGQPDLWLLMAPNFLTGGWHASKLVLDKVKEDGKSQLDDAIRDMRAKYGRVAAANFSMRLNKAFSVLADTKPAKRGP